MPRRRRRRSGHRNRRPRRRVGRQRRPGHRHCERAQLRRSHPAVDAIARDSGDGRSDRHHGRDRGRHAGTGDRHAADHRGAGGGGPSGVPDQLPRPDAPHRRLRPDARHRLAAGLCRGGDRAARRGPAVLRDLFRGGAGRRRQSLRHRILRARNRGVARAARRLRGADLRPARRSDRCRPRPIQRCAEGQEGARAGAGQRLGPLLRPRGD